MRIFYPATEKDVFKINYVPDKAQGQQTLYIDPASGELLDDIGWQRYSALAKVVEWGTMTHLGLADGSVESVVELHVLLAGAGGSDCRFNLMGGDAEIQGAGYHLCKAQTVYLWV